MLARRRCAMNFRNLRVRSGLFLSFHKELKCFAIFSENKYLLFKQSELINNQHLVYLWSGTMQTLLSFLPLLFSVTVPWNLLKHTSDVQSLIHPLSTLSPWFLHFRVNISMQRLFFTHVGRRYGFKFTSTKVICILAIITRVRERPRLRPGLNGNVSFITLNTLRDIKTRSLENFN